MFDASEKWSLRFQNICFFLFFLIFPLSVYSQLIDNRDLPSELLRIKPPFVATDRVQIATQDDKVYIILDNADDIKIVEFKDSGTTEAVLIGNVRVRFDGSFLRAEKVIVTMKDSVVINIGAYGNVDFTFGGTKYLADNINYQPDMERGVMYNVRSIIGASFGGGDKPWFYRAEKVTIQSSSRFVIDNVTLSTSDTRFDHFGIKVTKLWYLQGKVALIFGLEYMTGQASFLWLPVFLQLEGQSGIRTSFGSEKRIGYYFINNYTLDSKIGTFDFGFDFYERQGQYFQMKYEAPQVGILQKFNLETSLANDVRIVKNGDLYSQWVLPQFNDPNEFQRMTQFAWHYKLDMAVGTNGVLFSFNTEDLNDPYFRSKYSYRSRFDDSDSINFAELLNPTQNSWFGYQGDANPSLNSITRGFTLSANNFNMSGSWELIRVTKPNEENKGNQFLNSYFDYELRSLTLPSMSYNFGTLDLYDYEYTSESMITVVKSDGKSNTMHMRKLPEYEKSLANQSNRTINKEVSLQNNGTYRTNFLTNYTPITIDMVVTNKYQWVDLSLSASASASFSAQKTFGTNDSSEVADINLLDTNWTTIADLNKHEEKGSLDFDVNFFDQMWNINNGFNVQYQEQWSSFAENFTNTQRDSGIKIDYALGTTLSPEKVWNDDEWYRSSVSFETTVNYSYPLYYLLRLQQDFVTESQFTWKNIFQVQWLQWQRENILGLELSATWNLRDRVPTDEQQTIIDADPNNIYINNRIYDRITVAAKTQFFWLHIGTEATIDILETTTNNNPNNFRPIAGSSFTNRFIGGYPKLLVEFKPSSDYHYIPKFTYRYNLFEESQYGVITNSSGDISPTTLRSDKSFNFEFLWDLRLKNYQIPALYPFIYELSEIGFVLQYYQDFINVRNSYLRLDFTFGVKFTKYLTFRFTSRMLNNKIYLYYGGTFNGQQILAPGEVPKNFWDDLADGLRIWDQSALKRSSFKLQSLNFELIHDLDTWDMRVIFNLGRRVDDVKQIAFWEPYIGVAFTMKGSNAADIFPEFQKRFVPAEYQ